MKYRKRFINKAAALFVCAALLWVTAAGVSAASVSDLDLTKTGTITLTLTDADGAAVSGGALTIYQVAALYLDDGDMAYTYTTAFGTCAVTLDVTDTSLVSALLSYVSGHAVTGAEQTVASDGTVSFTGLEMGLYLIAQTTESADYETISPFVVTLPMEADGAWEYTVNATPKVGTVTVIEEQPEEPEEPEEPEQPEEETEEEETPTPGEELPQTGQLNWPVSALLIGGLLLLFVGWRLKASARKTGRYAS